MASPQRYIKRAVRAEAAKLQLLVRSRGLEPPRVAPLAPQASASTNSATTADGMSAGSKEPGAQATALDVTNHPGRNKGCAFGTIALNRPCRRDRQPMSASR